MNKLAFYHHHRGIASCDFVIFFYNHLILFSVGEDYNVRCEHKAAAKRMKDVYEDESCSHLDLLLLAA